MAHVIVEVNGQPYTMQCPDGEENHLRELAKLLDTEVTRIKQSVGTVGDIRLLVMSGLMLADRLSESARRIEALEEEVRDILVSRVTLEAQSKALEVRLTQRLALAAKRLEVVARELA
ncbi:MAG: cell division protein ZapA [Rhizobiales bacterium]|nr:cell division protein ZapA [Hyphomicrobiales bacterium]